MPFPQAAGRCVLLMLLLVTGCGGGPKAVTTYDETYDFGSLRTWAFHPEARKYVEAGVRPADDPDQTRYAAPEQINGIMQVVGDALDAKGYTRAPESEADFLVGIEGSGVPMTKTSYGYAGPYWARGYDYDKVNYEGTLIIDVIRRQDNQLLWRGMNDGLVLTPDNFTKTVEGSVNKIMQEFPPK